MSSREIREMSKDKKIPRPALQAIYIKRKGFFCTNHILYCPDLSKADMTKAFYLTCSRHNLVYKIKRAKQSREFMSDFPNGCKET
jgi:hypothetical protein